MAPNIVIIVQARMQSTRLPGKILLEVDQKPLLETLIERLKRVKNASKIVIATSTEKADDVLVEFCQRFSIPYFRGSNEDVLERYFQTAKEYQADIIVRVTSDCPLIDPAVIDQVIESYEPDYVSNTLKLTYPRGMDTEVFSFAALEKAANQATRSCDREHVTSYIYTHPEIFHLKNVPFESNQSQYRLTVDTPEDFELISLLLQHLPSDFTLDDILQLLQKHPEWVKINAHIQQR